MGAQQSGALDLLIADLGKDALLLEQARADAIQVLKNDPDLSNPENEAIKSQINSIKKTSINWSRIS
jgi:ATP-dependent DNA helicase RecG